MAGPTTLKFGKHQGKTFAEILECDGKYLLWYKNKFLDPADVKNNGKYAKSNQYQIEEINKVLANAKTQAGSGYAGRNHEEDMGDTELPESVQASIAKFKDTSTDELVVIKKLCEANQALLIEILEALNNKGARVLS